MGSYVPNTKHDRQKMLQSMGVSSIEELYSVIPKEILLNRELDIPKGKSEWEVREEMSRIASKNLVFKSIFRGCGSYNHYIPSIVKQVTSKEEFEKSLLPKELSSKAPFLYNPSRW